MPTLLIANRGEIAVRIARTAREMGIRTVAVYSDIDRDALHVATCDIAIPIGAAPPTQSYLNIPAILDAAHRSGATLLHPGYGFLSENANFADAVLTAGIMWVGPTPEAMRALGGKLSARSHAEAAGVSILPGGRSQSVGFPLLIKASAGGGGRGMRRVDRAEDFDEALASASAEALAAFGDGTVYAERLVERARHVEVQVFGDGRGGVAVLGERDCSLQRRHQKLVEEAPFDALGPARDALHAAASRLAASVNYRSAGTLEFLWDGDHAYFLEVNARLQVEHPVTEAVFGLDLVRCQLELALGGGLPVVVDPRGHAIECRIVAEDPAQGYLPSPGTLTSVAWPAGPGVRVDAGVASGSIVSPHYDALLAKVIVHAPTRDAAIARMRRALRETLITGVATTAERLLTVIESPWFRAGDFHTGTLADLTDPPVDAAWFLAAAALSESGSSTLGSTVTQSPTPWATLGRWP